MIRNLPLWLLGLCLILVAALIPTLLGTPNFAGTPFERGGAWGQVIGQVVLFLSGVTLVVLHVIRRWRAPKKPQRPEGW